MFLLLILDIYGFAKRGPWSFYFSGKNNDIIIEGAETFSLLIPEIYGFIESGLWSFNFARKIII